MFSRIYNFLAQYICSLATIFFAKLILESISPDKAENYLFNSVLN